MTIAWQGMYGWGDFSRIHERVLRDLPDGAVCVELGVAYGKGLATLVDVAERLGRKIRAVGVDLFSPTVGDNMAAGFSDLSLEDTIRRLTLAGVRPDQYELIKGDTADAAARFQQVHYVFLDASHLQPGVTRDLEAWYPKIVPGGYTGGHDWGFSGVCDAVGMMFPSLIGVEVIDSGGSLSWFHRKG